MATEINKILDDIFRRIGLNRRDGHPLYAYQLQRIEIDRLQAELRLELQLRPKLERQDLSGAFCLFAAEWFRRNHEEGPWKWETILEHGLALSGDVLNTVRQHTSRMTESGLRWWNVPLVETGASRRFLVTLACQGGLPLKTLKKHNAPLRRFLKSALQHHERWPTEPIDRVIEEKIGDLPSTLQNEVVQRLCAELIAAIFVLRRESNAAAALQQSRLKYLKQIDPQWDHSIPLRIDDQEIQELIVGLLDAEPPDSANDMLPFVETNLILDGAVASLQRRLNHNSRIREADLAKLLGVSGTNALRPRMTLFLAGNRKQVPVAKVGRASIGDTYQLNRVDGTALSDPEALGEVLLIASQGSEQIASTAVAGGEPLGDSPWVFDGDEPHSLIGLGSVRTRRNWAIIALPEEASWEAAEDSRTEILPQSIAGRRLLKMSGSVEVCSDGAVYRVRTNQEQEQASFFAIAGHRASLGLNGSEIWLGFPEIREVSTHGMNQRIPDREIRWKYRGSDEWRSLTPTCHGDLVIRVERDRSTLFQTHVSVFPEEFSARVSPKSTNEGRILLRNLGKAEVHVASCEGLESNVVGSRTEQIISVTHPPAKRPDLISLQIRFDNGGITMIDVSCPTSTVGVIDAAGRMLPKDLPIPLSMVSGLALQVLSPKLHIPKITAGNDGHFLAHLRRPNEKDPGVFTLPLSSIVTQVSSVLSRLDDIDGSAIINVVQAPATEPIYKFTVSRYPGRLDKVQCHLDPEEQEFTDIYVPENVVDGLRMDPAQIRIAIAPLGYPDMPYPETVLERLEGFRWRVFHLRLNPGVCLVTAWLDDYTCLRPLRLSVRMSELNKATQQEAGVAVDFDTVLTMFDREQRRRDWDGFFDALTSDYSGVNWERVDAMLEASRTMPITTFETIAALVRNPEAAARIGLLHAGKSWIWDRLEELPFLWCLIPVSVWVKAASRICEQIQNSLTSLPPEQIKGIITATMRTFLDPKSSRPGVLSCAAMCLQITDGRLPQEHSVQELAPLFIGSVPGLLKKRAAERTRLIAAHDVEDTRESWPNIRLPMSYETREILADLLITDGHPNQYAVLNAPALAAAHSVHEIPEPAELLALLQELRGVDPGWFDRACEIAMYILAGRRLTADPKCFSLKLEE